MVSFGARNQCTNSDLSPNKSNEPIDVLRSDHAFRGRLHCHACPASGSFSGERRITVQERAKFILYRKFCQASGWCLLMVAGEASLLVDSIYIDEVLHPFSPLPSVLQRTDLNPWWASSPSACLDFADETPGVSPNCLLKSYRRAPPFSPSS